MSAEPVEAHAPTHRNRSPCPLSLSKRNRKQRPESHPSASSGGWLVAESSRSIDPA